uniref:Aminopeptidase n=2 Tax=Lygus hesperus TaxID=30085 RepID=A0A146MHD0_LYGHE
MSWWVFAVAALTTAGPSLAKKSRVPAFRLNEDVVPLHYHVTLVPKRDCTFSGTVAIQLDVRNSTDLLKFNSRDLSIDPSSVALSNLKNDGEEVDVVQLEKELGDSNYNLEEGYKNLTLDFPGREFVTVAVGEPLQSPGRYLLYMAFNGTMNSRRTLGLYCTGTRHRNRTRFFVASAFEPNLASTAFPCWDEPGFKAKFTISLAHDNQTVTLSNMPLKESKPYDDGEEEGWRLDTFHTTPKMAPYLIGIMVSENIAHLDSKLTRGRKVSIWGHPSRVQYGDLPMRLANRHMEFLEEYTSFPDPMPKQDMLTVRNYIAGGLENWGIVSYDEKLVLFDPRYRRNKQVVLRASNLIAHELSHIWFGNLVTPKWWDDIWLSEGFSSYFAALSTSKVYPVWGHETASWILARENSMEADARDTTHPLRPDVSPGSGFKEVFDQIIYHKGQSIVRMLNFTIGEEALKEGLRSYLKERAFSTASHEHLWNSLERAARKHGSLPENITLSEVMDGWMNQRGYPVVSVIRDYQTGEVTISQRSILDKEDETTPAREDTGGGWWIPLTFTYEGENGTSTSTKVWLDPSEMNTTISDPAPSDRWLLFNLHGAGYYRVRYDRENAGYLLNDLSDLWLDDRVQVVSDMVELARLGFSPVADAMKAMSWLKDEISPYPWLALLGSAHKTLSLFKGTELEDMFTEFMNEILSAGMNRVEDDDPHKKQLVALSCEIGVKKCTEMAKENFKKWAEDPSFKIQDDVRGSVYCYGVANGDSKTWQLVNSRFASTTDMKDKKDLLKALSCTKDPKLLSKYLSWALEPGKGGPGIKKTSVMFKALAKRDPDMLLSALVSKGTAFKRRNMRWKRLLEHVAVEVNNEQQLNKLKAVLTSGKDEFKSELGSSALIRLAESNVDWLEKNMGETKAWLQLHKKSVKA